MSFDRQTRAKVEFLTMLVVTARKRGESAEWCVCLGLLIERGHAIWEP